jgi:hypothetical protein
VTRPICAQCVEVEHGLTPVTHVRKTAAGDRVTVTRLLCQACREGVELRGKDGAGVGQSSVSRRPAQGKGQYPGRRGR